VADYQAMYAVLFNKISVVVEELQSVQRQAEEIYISTELPDKGICDTGNASKI